MNVAPASGNDRPILRFAEEIKDRFSFLEPLGFRQICSAATFMRLESPSIGINIFHGRRSFEIGLEIYSTLAPTETYAIPEIVRLVDKGEGDQYKYYAAHTMQGVAEGVGKLAEHFQRCTAAGILSDNQLFARLKQQRQELITRYALEVELRQARRNSEIAWCKKDYAAFVEALKPLRESLTPTELRKLEYAEKQCGK